MPPYAGGSFDLWQFKFQCLCKINKWEEEEAVGHLLLLLDGEVVWYTNMLVEKKAPLKDVLLELNKT